MEADIADLNEIVGSNARIRKIMAAELNDVAKKYGQPRRCEILYEVPGSEETAEEEQIPDYPVTLFFTRESYFKKVTEKSLRNSGEHKLKEGDEIIFRKDTHNAVELLVFTDRHQVYKCRAADFPDGKVSQMGEYLPTALGMDEDEKPIFLAVLENGYKGWFLFCFANGKCAKIPAESYATKQNRRKLIKAYSDKEALADMLYLPEETEIAIRTSAGRLLLVGTAQIAAKTTKDSAGVAVITLKKNQHISELTLAEKLELADPHRYRVRSLPAAGAILRQEDSTEQMSLL